MIDRDASGRILRSDTGGERKLNDVGREARFGGEDNPLFPIKKACGIDGCRNLVDTFSNKRGHVVYCEDCRKEAIRLSNASYYERIKEKKNAARRTPEHRARERARKRRTHAQTLVV